MGLETREKEREKSLERSARANPAFVWAAGREPSYRAYLADCRESVNSIESFDHAIAELADLNSECRSPLNAAEMTELASLSPGQACQRFSYIDPYRLARMNLLVKRLQYLSRTSDRLQSTREILERYLGI